MAIPISFSGTIFSIPSQAERGWAANVNAYLQALGANALPRAGGSFSLSNDLDLGATATISMKALASKTASASATGFIRLANTDTINFRNASNTADLLLGVSASNRLQFGTVNIPTISSTDIFTNKTFVAPALGTPASVILTNATGLPLTTGVTGTLPVANGGTGVTTSTGSGNNVLSTSPTLVTPALGTPASGVMTNVTGLPLTSGVTGTLPVANGGTGVTSSTGSGSVVLSNSPTLVTPTLGAFVASASSRIGSAGGNSTSPSTATTNILLYNNLPSNWSGIGSGSSGEMYFVTGSSGTPTTGLLIDILGGNYIGRIASGNPHVMRAASNTPTTILNTGSGNSLITYQNGATGTLGFIGFDSSSNLKLQNSIGTDLISATPAGSVTLGPTSGVPGPHTLYGNNASTTASSVDVYGLNLKLGADNSTTVARTNATSKRARVTVPHYTNAEEDVSVFIAGSDSTNNFINIGGGAAAYNATTTINFYTGSGGTTTSGTLAASIDSAGVLTAGPTAGGGGLKLNNSTASYTPGTLDYYEEGSFSLTASSGFTTTPAITVYFVRVGKQVTLNFLQLSATSNSNATSIPLDGLPARLRPTTATQVLVPVGDNSTSSNTMGVLSISNSNTITLYKDNFHSNWTSAGNKGFGPISVSYQIQ